MRDVTGDPENKHGKVNILSQVMIIIILIVKTRDIKGAPQNKHGRVNILLQAITSMAKSTSCYRL